MEITNKEVTYIDNLLKKNGIKYWDVRIELLDHVVSELENTTNDVNFKTAVWDIFKKLGWKENFNGSSFENVIKQYHNSASKKIRRNFSKFRKKELSNPLVIGVFFFVLFSLYEIAHYKSILKYSLIFIMLAYIIPLGYFLSKKVYYKSLQLGHTASLTFFGLTLLNTFIHIPKVLFDFNIFDYPAVISLIFTVTLLYSYIGFKFFFIEFTKTNNIYKKLKTL